MNPYAPPGAEGDDPKKTTRKKIKRGRYSARFKGKVLIVSRDADLPSVCLKCGTHDAITRRANNFQWTPLWARLLFPFCLIGVIAMFVTRQVAMLAVPLCASCNTRWTAARNVTIGGVVAILGAFVYVRTLDDPRTGLAILGVAVFGFLALAFLFVRPRMLQVDRIDEREIHLKNFHTAAAEEVVEGASEG